MDTHDIYRPAEVTDLMNKLRLATDKIQELTTALAPWPFELEVNIIAGTPSPFGPTYDVLVTGKKKNGEGFRKLLKQTEVLIYRDDFATLIRQLTKDIVEFMYEEQIHNQITADLAKAFGNVVKLTRGVTL